MTSVHPQNKTHSRNKDKVWWVTLFARLVSSYILIFQNDDNDAKPGKEENQITGNSKRECQGYTEAIDLKKHDKKLN